MVLKLKFMLIMLLAIIFADVSAQQNQVLYYMNLPQNHLLNPALRPSNSLYIGLPLISGINFNLNSNLVNLSDIFMKSKTGDTVNSILNSNYNIDKFISKINNKNSFDPETSVQLLGLGFSTGKAAYVFLDITERFEANVVFPGDLLKLALKGNQGFIGSKIDLSSLRGDLKYYREIGLGFSKNFSTKLRIGVRGKLLFGIAAASLENNSLGITVHDDYTHTLDANLGLNLSGPVKVTTDANGKVTSVDLDKNAFDTKSGIINFFSGKKNFGLGLDVGATYQINDKFEVSASITDLGYIKWRKDVNNLVVKSQFEFSGLNLIDVVNGTKTIDQVTTELLDSLKNSFKLTDSKNAFTTFLPFGITFGGSYRVSKDFSIGLLSYSRIIGQQIREAATLSANVNIGNAFSTSLSYTAANHRYDNLGLGLAFRPGIFQFYILADRVPLTWNNLKVNSGTIYIPASWNMVNLRLGMNIALGNKVRKKDDKPMVVIQ